MIKIDLNQLNNSVNSYECMNEQAYRHIEAGIQGVCKGVTQGDRCHSNNSGRLFVKMKSLGYHIASQVTVAYRCTIDRCVGKDSREKGGKFSSERSEKHQVPDE